MMIDSAKVLAKELCNRYGLRVYIHTEPTIGYNLRFQRPIESVINSPRFRTVYVVQPIDGGATIRDLTEAERLTAEKDREVWYVGR